MELIKKIFLALALLLLFSGCQKWILNNSLLYTQHTGIDLQKITDIKESYVAKGSHVFKKDTVVATFNIAIDYHLIVFKLNQPTNGWKVIPHSFKKEQIAGHFSIVTSKWYDLSFATSVFETLGPIKNIDLISDRGISDLTNNDSIKSFHTDFGKFAIKINGQDHLMHSEVEYYDLENISADFLFYHIKNELYLFVLTPSDGKSALPENALYDLLFPASSTMNKSNSVVLD